jgi:phosphoribosylformylglycinamidine synthase I
LTLKFGVVVFPGTWSDQDCHYVIKNQFKQRVEYIWHKDTDLSGIDCLILPGGFSYGDFLRCGALARFSPIMKSVISFASQGKPVIGICNGFQILCESGLLPGVLTRNHDLKFKCEWVHLKVVNNNTIFTSKTEKDKLIRMPISHGEGNFYADEKSLLDIERNNQVVLRYSSINGSLNMKYNPNGSVNNIAGIVNIEGNVLGMMPHPERNCESLLGGTDGKIIFQSVLDALNIVVPA